MDFGGGLDLVFGGEKNLSVPVGDKATVQTVITALATSFAKAKKEMFAVDSKM